MSGGNVRDGRPPEAGRLIAEILALADRLRRRLDAPCEAKGVSPSRFAVMSTIEQAGEAGCSQTELAERLGLSESNVSALVEALRKSRLLFRFRSKVDRRRSVLLLSETGKELVQLLSAARDVVAASLIHGISSRQIGELRTLLAALDGRLNESDGGTEVAAPTESPTSSLRRAS